MSRKILGPAIGIFLWASLCLSVGVTSYGISSWLAPTERPRDGAAQVREIVKDLKEMQKLAEGLQDLLDSAERKAKLWKKSAMKWKNASFDWQRLAEEKDVSKKEKYEETAILAVSNAVVAEELAHKEESGK